ncbi:uncharacterized protein GGS25DRAFT_453130 [Hypoxylon fragiforme]|uniref:uncharacterized protein n=1 Tax=Hypoxylon fragiforme TaxID=63214 RepID=UPI0020C677D0|nr:uncharacterized protein GGS25DRAFT_453130 [Hypoxylon fragiforme]KAI2604254.1 hypothetical protein GGS25DRAFT_453130 [Hypoxylon fragiforme]
MGKFGSRSIASRPKPFQTNRISAKHSSWKGPFRFFDLPSELRYHILKLILLEGGFTHSDVIHLFQTCQQVYAEAASMFYHEVYLDNLHFEEVVNTFLTGPFTRVAPRQYVRNLTIKFALKEHVHLFGESYGAAINAMAEKGTLQTLRLEIGNNFPCNEFWGDEDETCVYEDVRVAAGKGKGAVLSAPLFITEMPFQSFLRFLEGSKVPKITLHVEADDHSKLWCPFHRSPPSGAKCDGEFMGFPGLLRIKTRSLIGTLKGATSCLSSI